MKIVKSKRYNKYKSKSFRNNKGGSSKNCLYNPETELMENECPGLKYFYEIKDNLKKDHNAVYMVFGHGCDLYEEVSVVPNRCKYYTSTSCGLASENNPKITQDFFNNTLDLERPEKYFAAASEEESLDGSLEEYNDVKYRRIIGLYEHNEGESYVNNKNSSFLSMGEFAGLRKMGDMIINNKQNKSFNGFMQNGKSKKQEYTLEIYYLQHFAGSIFPTTLQVCKLLHENFSENELNNFEYPLYNPKYHDKFINLIKNNFSIDFASIMEYLPGKFINSACRPICDGPTNTREIIVLDQPINDESRLKKKNEFIERIRRDSLSDSPELHWNTENEESQDEMENS